MLLRFFWLGLILLLAACAPGQPALAPVASPAPPGIVATIGDTAITAAEWQQARAYATVTLDLLAQPGAALDEPAVLESFIEDHFIALAAAEAGFTLTPAQVAEEEERILLVAGREAADLADLLAATGLSQEAWRQELSRALLAASYLDQVILAGAPPGERRQRQEAWLQAQRAARGVRIFAEIAPPEGIRVGDRAPDFTLPSLDGGEITLSDLRGQAVLLNFWASWCLPCRQEMPLFQQTYERRGEEGFLVLAVNVGESPAQAQQFMTSLGLTFPAALDQDQTLSRQYRVFGLPTSFFIDRRGVIHYVLPGAVRPAEFSRQIDEILATTGDNR